jgi:hypothetical protein
MIAAMELLSIPFKPSAFQVKYKKLLPEYLNHYMQGRKQAGPFLTLPV